MWLTGVPQTPQKCTPADKVWPQPVQYCGVIESVHPLFDTSWETRFLPMVDHDVRLRWRI